MKTAQSVDTRLLKAAPPGEDPVTRRPGDKTRAEVRLPSEAYRTGFDRIDWGRED